jgi:hypothetical protein
MPWTAESFQRHNHGLSPAHAAHAASVANAILRRTGDEGLSIATANAREKEHRTFGGMTGIAQHLGMPSVSSHVGAPMGHISGMAPAHVQPSGFHQTGIRPVGLPRRDGGGQVGGMAPTPGLQPTAANANPMMQGYLQRYAQMSPEQLQELVVRLGNSPQGAIAKRVLQQKQVMSAQSAPSQQQQPAPSQQQSGMQPAQQARGGETKRKETTVPILAAGGEFIISPHHVARLGDGDVEEGHRRLDRWVVSQRADIIKEMQKLKPPVRT